MERVTSRKNNTVAHLRRLGAEKAYRSEKGLFLCDGRKLLSEALAAGAEIECILWSEAADTALPDTGGELKQLCAPPELLQYVSPLKNSPGPVFSVKMPERPLAQACRRAIVLENIQDPGNVGTVLRTAFSFGIDCVLLLGDCADVYSPKSIRATMGAIFKQTVIETDFDGLESFLSDNGLPLYGAALSDSARDIRTMGLRSCAVAIGSEGGGLSPRLLEMCRERMIIPMQPGSESLNAAVAASLIMWEMYR